MSLSTLRSSDLPPTREINHISFDLGARARAGDLFLCVQCKNTQSSNSSPHYCSSARGALSALTFPGAEGARPPEACSQSPRVPLGELGRKKAALLSPVGLLEVGSAPLRTPRWVPEGGFPSQLSAHALAPPALESKCVLSAQALPPTTTELCLTARTTTARLA